MQVLDIRNLLENIERKVYQQEITTDDAVTKLINTEIAKAINLKTKKESEAEEDLLKNVSCTTLECYLDHLKAVEAKLKKPCNISAQCTPVEERDINRRLLLILNRLKGYSRK
ncbi:hypothetical protein POKO110462_16715 [Pontibacter korlensis]|uniref:Uncharacterized protein n=1 Tax=Pontibacter korlensis TaxID=400092 RepID=A0A0E3ZC89_9BACT|nr:hypothetical protein [Pontibacter korlensis]AKD02468.1 hypothetical protein PKOR_04230 [Pontibacter korlensis]